MRYIIASTVKQSLSLLEFRSRIDINIPVKAATIDRIIERWLLL